MSLPFNLCYVRSVSMIDQNFCSPKISGDRVGLKNLVGAYIYVVISKSVYMQTFQQCVTYYDHVMVTDLRQYLQMVYKIRAILLLRIRPPQK